MFYFCLPHYPKIVYRGFNKKKRIVMANQSSSLKGIFRPNWLTLVVFIVLAVVFLRKDLSLNFNLNAPQEEEMERPRNYENPSHKTSAQRKKKKEKLTDVAPVKEQTKKGTSLLNFFDNPFGGGKKSYSYQAALDKIDESVKQAYLKRFAHVAMNEQEKFGVPASVILASALLHSCSGKSDLAQNHNNQFAVPCSSDWDGPGVDWNDKCYRGYETAWMSFRNHSQYVTSGKFEHLKKLEPTDYKGWVKGLANARYSEDNGLYKNLIRIIEQYGLSDLDRP